MRGQEERSLWKLGRSESRTLTSLTWGSGRHHLLIFSGATCMLLFVQHTVTHHATTTIKRSTSTYAHPFEGMDIASACEYMKAVLAVIQPTVSHYLPILSLQQTNSPSLGHFSSLLIIWVTSRNRPVSGPFSGPP